MVAAACNPTCFSTMTRNSPKLQDDNDKQEVGWQGHLGGPGGRMFSETEAETAFVLSSMTPHLAVTDLSKLVLCCVQYSDVANVALVVSLQKGVVNFGNEKVMPPIPLIASSAEQVYNGLRYHPSSQFRVLETPGTQSRIPNPESLIPNLESGIPIPGFGVPDIQS